MWHAVKRVEASRSDAVEYIANQIGPEAVETGSPEFHRDAALRGSQMTDILALALLTSRLSHFFHLLLVDPGGPRSELRRH